MARKAAEAFREEARTAKHQQVCGTPEVYDQSIADYSEGKIPYFFTSLALHSPPYLFAILLFFF